MLSLERFRKLLGPDCPPSDAELEAVRQAVSDLARVAIEGFVEKHANSQNRPISNEVAPMEPDDNPPAEARSLRSPDDLFGCALRLVPEDQRTTVEERAAIIEFDGQLARDKAERLALTLVLTEGRK